MNPSLFLTVFVTLAGVFTFWCALKDYDWFFEFPGPSQVFTFTVGRPVARIIYTLFGLFLLGYGAIRTIDPPRKIPTEFLTRLATPQEIDLTHPLEAARSLRQNPEKTLGLESDQNGWISFWSPLESDTSYFQDARDSTTVGPDFHKGSVFRAKSYRSKKLDGRVIYFDSKLSICNNVLFSKHPLNSAAFAIVICTPETSRANGFEESLAVFYCRADTPLYKQLIR